MYTHAKYESPTHAKYESPISYNKKVMANVKVFQK